MKKEQIKKAIVLMLCFLLLEMISPVEVHAKSKIKLNKTTATIYVGKSVDLKITGTTKKVTWSSSNEKIAIVNSKGKVTGKKVGNVTIKAKIGTEVYSCQVKVKSILLVNESTIKIGENGSIIVTFKGNGKVFYRIDKTDIISCSWNKGDEEEWVNYKSELFISGKKNGTAYIYLSNTQNNEEIRIKVTVEGIEDEIEDENPPKNSSVSITLPSIPTTLHEYYTKNEVEQTYTITNARYEVTEYSYKDTVTVDIYFDGLKTYDYRGSGQSSRATIGWKLYDDNDNVIDSGTCRSPSLSEGETFKDAHDYIFDLKSGNYRLEILSVN